MKLPRRAEAQLALEAQRHPDDHIVFPEDQYRRRDGALPVSRDGLQELLHRRLFRVIREPALGRRKLVRTCDRWGCQQPFHYMLTTGLRRGAKTRCSNGHLYSEVGTTASGHCAVCAPKRAAARAGRGDGMAARNAAKEFCPAGHEYTPANTYRQSTPSGTRRKCRRCNADRAQARRKSVD